MKLRKPFLLRVTHLTKFSQKLSWLKFVDSSMINCLFPFMYLKIGCLVEYAESKATKCEKH